MSENRGLSNTLGFVLLFGVVFISITAVSVFGVGALEESRDATIEQNAALSMQSVSDVISDLREENVTTKLSVLRGGGGSIGNAENTTITVEVGSEDYTFDFQPIVYRFEQTNLVYEAGAVMRTQGNSGVLLDGPNFNVSGKATILPIVSTSPATSGSTSGHTISIYLEQTHSELNTPDSLPSENVEITINTTEARAGVWNRTLEERHGMDCSVPTDSVTCTTSDQPDYVIVRDIRVIYDVVT